MRKRNHVIPLHLNAKELGYLEKQVKQSGLAREELLRSLIMGTELRAKPVPITRICSARQPDSATTPTSLPESPTLTEKPISRA